MKSCKAEVVLNERKRARVGILSLLTLMVLTLSVGRTLLAEDEDVSFWHADTKKPVAYFNIENADDRKLKDETVGLVLGSKDGSVKPNYAEFVSKLQSEPEKFIEALRSAELDIIGRGPLDGKDGKWTVYKDLKDFQKQVTDGLKSDKIKDDVWKETSNGDKREVYHQLIEALVGKPGETPVEAKKRLEKLNLKELIHELTKDITPESKKKAEIKKILEALKLVDKKPEAETVTNPPKPENPLDKAIKEWEEKFAKHKKEAEEAAAAKEAAHKAEVEDLKKKHEAEIAAAKAAGVKEQGPIGPQPDPNQAHKPGELTDKQIDEMAERYCDKLKALQTPAKPNQALLDKLADLEKQLEDAKAKAKRDNDLAALTPHLSPKLREQPENNNGLDTNALLSKLLAPEQNLAAQPSSQPPFFPQNGNQNQNPEQETPTQAYQQPQPNMPPQEQPATPPFFMPPQMNSGPNVPFQLKGGMLDNPIDQVQEINNVADDNENPPLLMNQLTPQAGLPELVRAKWDVYGRMQNVKAAQTQASELEKEMRASLQQVLNKDAKNLLTSSALQKVQADEQAYEAAKGQQQQIQQMMMMGGMGGGGQNARGQQQQYLPMMMMVNQQIQAAKAKVDQNNAAISALAEQKDDSVAGLKQSLREATSAKNKLKSEYNTLTARYNEAQQAVAQTQQMQQMQMAAALNPPQTNAAPNIKDRVTNFNQNGPQRTQTPQIGGRSGAGANPIRGGLGAMAGSAAGPMGGLGLGGLGGSNP